MEQEEKHTCMECAAIELGVRGCPGCVRLVKYVHFGVDLVNLGHQQSELAAVQRSVFIGTIIHLFVLAIVLVIAWGGVRNPLVFAGVLFGWFALQALAGESLVRLQRKRLTLAKMKFWESIQRENSSMRPREHMIIDAHTIVEALREPIPEVPEERPV